MDVTQLPIFYYCFRRLRHFPRFPNAKPLAPIGTRPLGKVGCGGLNLFTPILISTDAPAGGAGLIGSAYHRMPANPTVHKQLASVAKPAACEPVRMPSPL